MSIISRRIRRSWVLSFVLAAAFMAFAANAANILVVDAPESADIIVVLAGETDYRPARGLELLRQGYAGRLLFDVPTGTRIYDITVAQAAERYIRGLPEADKVGICPIEGLSTRDESHDVEKCLAHEHGSRILIVTSDYHTRRALGIFRKELPGKFFSIAAARNQATFGFQWWAHRQWAKTCAEEWLRLLWWSAVDRWR